MKFKFYSVIFVLFTILIDLNNFAQGERLPLPPKIEGQFVFTGQVRKLAILHLERVYALFEEGKARLDVLDGLGYQCEPQASHWYACRKLRDDLEIPSNVIKSVAEPLIGKLTLDFGKVNAEPSLVHHTEFQWEWQVSQDVVLNGKLRKTYDFLHMDNIEKLIIYDQEFIFNAEAENKISFSSIKEMTLDTPDKNGYMTYYLKLILEPKVL